MQRPLTEPSYKLISPEQRNTHTDRRTNQALAAYHSCFRHRRLSTRRDTDTLDGRYVDSHHISLAYLVFGAMLFSILDAFFTLQLIAHGSDELNPIMAYLIESGVHNFLVIKFFVTGAGLIFLLMHKHHLLFNHISGHHLLVFSFVCYFILMCYQASMIQHLPLIF